MKDKTLMGGLIFTGVGILALALLYIFVVRDTEVPSAPISSVPLSDVGGVTVYEIVPSQSEVRFQLDEELRTVPTTVIGVTNQVAGQIGVNLADLSTAVIGQIRINARTLQTDNDFRNNAIRNYILLTDAYEYITFQPTQLDNLPAAAQVGEKVMFTVLGDLTIRDVTYPVTFAVTAVATSPTELTGSATTTIQRQNFGLEIPSAPGVANVSEDILLQIEWVAQSE